MQTVSHNEFVPCFSCFAGHGKEPARESTAAQKSGTDFLPYAIDDPEGARVPEGAPPVIDAHVHLFPERLFEALWSWFDKYGWPIRYKLHTPAVVDFLLQRGVEHLVVCAFAHKAAMAESLNTYLADLARAESRVTALGTVFPGESNARGILEAAFADGLGGVKLHCHVQGVAPDDPVMHEVYELCARLGKPILIHAGKAPRSPAYPRNTDEICSVDRVESVLRSFPDLKLCVPHLGADEYRGYGRLLERYDNLWLDTTMALANYLPGESPWFVAEMRPERVMYGTDFPNIPYAWDRELKYLLARAMSEVDLAKILGGTARDFYGIGAPRAPQERNP